MRSFRSTERHLGMLKLPGKVKVPRAPFAAGFQQRSYTNHVAFRFAPRNARNGGSVIKLREITPISNRMLATKATPIPLLNPNKLAPDSSEISILPKPIVPLTAPRFPPKQNGVDTLPSVTKILSVTMPASSQFLLDRWKEAMIKKLGAAGFATYQKDTFERGRLLHALLANYLLGHGNPDKELSVEIVANLWKSIEKVVREKISNVRLVEHTVTHSDMKYRGIVDCVAFYENELVVIDFKTAEKPKKSIASLFDNPLQVTAYCGAINNDESIPKEVIDRNICAGLVIVAYIDGTEASVYHLGREKVLNEYWNQWTTRLDQYTRLEQMNKTAATSGTR